MKKLTIKIPQDRERLYTVIHYPAGEIQVRLTEEGLKACEHKDAYEIIANPIPDVVELAQLADALNGHRQFWERMLFLPYMPYARADRRFVEGDCFGLAVWGRLLRAMNFTTVWTFDVHSSLAETCVDHLANIRPEQVSALDIVIEELGKEGLILLLPDNGSRGRYDLAKYGLTVANGLKIRDTETGKLSGFAVAAVFRRDIQKAKKVLIVDDICDGGGTFIGLAEAIQTVWDEGPYNWNNRPKLYLYVSHGIFSKGTSELLEHFKRIFTSEYSIDRSEIKIPCAAKKYIFPCVLGRDPVVHSK